MTTDPKFETLLELLEKLPAIDLPAGRRSIGYGTSENESWWTKFSLNTEHPPAWRNVQELGHFLNDISVDERLPTVFKPMSPPSSMNGGVELLSWFIEGTAPRFTPDECAAYLAGSLPVPVDDERKWDRQ